MEERTGTGETCQLLRTGRRPGFQLQQPGVTTCLAERRAKSKQPLRMLARRRQRLVPLRHGRPSVYSAILGGRHFGCR